MTVTSDPAQLDWLLQRLLSETTGARHAVLLAADGIQMCHTAGLSTDQADRLAAIASGVQALAGSASAEFGNGRGGVRQSMTEFYGGILFIVGAGAGAQIAVLAADDADAGLVGAQMAALIEQVGEYLSAPPRGSRARLL
ncbi:roadblock/LC7 domain-containing protein [Nocardia carnea]|uniref:Roadblock/LC7 domain-containing protein n=1 Tax=Nocardia carnea TaxID=37328 RepID=A0ABW7TJG8_9NOCA|nr:roadblock/LC7 domain-containing protein [Nocardia carnea]